MRLMDITTLLIILPIVRDCQSVPYLPKYGTIR